MATIEQVEKLREKANVSYAEAKEALDKCDGDLLDAILYLEENGKVKSPENGGHYHSSQADGGNEYEKSSKKNNGYVNEYRHSKEKKDEFHSMWHKFWGWCKRMFKKGCVNTFEVIRYDEPVIKIPVIVFLFLLCFAFWVTVPLMIVGLFLGFKYHFRGPDLSKIDINKAMDAAFDAAEKAKNEFKTAAENHQKNNNDSDQ